MTISITLLLLLIIYIYISIGSFEKISSRTELQQEDEKYITFKKRENTVAFTLRHTDRTYEELIQYFDFRFELRYHENTKDKNENLIKKEYNLPVKTE